MSVTISVANNHYYCDRAGLTKIQIMECHCGDCDLGFDQGCDICGGSGEMPIAVYPFELNVANGNWCAIIRELGIGDPQDLTTGECWGCLMQGALSRVTPEALVKNPSIDFGLTGTTVYEAGRTLDQAGRYLKALRIIAEEAIRREEMVVWN